MKLTNKQIYDNFGHLEDHQWKHYNDSMGCMIYSKEHYLNELEKRNMVPFDMAERKIEQWERDNSRKEYELSPKGRRLVSFFKSASRDGFIKLSDYPKAVEEMKNMGISFDHDMSEFMKGERGI